jgi:exodeoxyribonuclease-5
VNITVKDLSNDQRAAYDSILRWLADAYAGVDNSPLLTLAGFAGTGKSTVVSLIANEIDLLAFCAYTGKATSVLRRKLAAAGTATVGAQRRSPSGEQSTDERPYCGTIHSLIYRPCDCRDPQVVEVQKPCPEKGCTAETLWLEDHSLCMKRHEGLVKTVKAFEALKPRNLFVYAEKDPETGECKHCHGKEWLRREALDRTYGLIIVDEASMVDDMMLRDLREYGVPILAVGDHGQLPPVGGSGSLMKNPALKLEKIHRQAEGNPIIALSKYIRENGRFPESVPAGDAVRFGQLRFVDRLVEERYENASDARLLEMGLACYTNRRRVGLNVSVRRARGTARNGRELPKAGEHVICLRNMKAEAGRPPVANGMRGVLKSDAIPTPLFNNRGERIGESETQLTGAIAFPEDEIEPHEYNMLRAQFGREKTFSSPEELERDTGLHSFQMAGALFDYGFAMTVHKLQGSQIDDLVVLAERPGPVSNDDYTKWAYTAATRAVSKLTVLR